MALYRKPHADEWFEVLSRFNPPQALQPRMVIERAGQADVCSVCGDMPSNDYQVSEDGLAPNAVATIRLCGDCVWIRRAMDEDWVPLVTH